jgi:WD40 repeat protein
VKLLLILPLILCATGISAELDFYRDVYPFLKTNCISCHNKTTTKADLNMETPELMIQGGESGPSIVPGKSAQSLIVLASLHQDDMEMPPPNNKSGAVNLTPAEISILKQWIDQGAKSSTQQERAVVLKPFAASVDPIYCVAMSRDGRYAACGRSNRIYIHDLATRQLITQFEAHRALVQSLAFSPDGRHLASGSFREVKLWRFEPQKAASQPTAATPADPPIVKKIADAGKLTILASALSADRKSILAGCSDGSVRVWDTATLKQTAELRGTLASTQKIAELEWTVAAQTLEQSFQKSEITRMEAQDKALDVLLGKARDAITTMQKVLPEKQQAVKPAEQARATAQKTVDELAAKLAASTAKDPAVEKELKTAQDKLITARMTEVSALAAVNAAQSNVKDAEDDVKRITSSKARNASAVAAANSAIAAAKAAQDKAATDLAALRQSIAKTVVKPLAVAFSPDGVKAAALFEDGVLRAWGVATGLVVEESATKTETTTLTAQADGSFTVVRSLALATPGIPRWNLARTWNDKQIFADRVNALRFSPDGRTLVTGGGELSRSGDIAFFDVAGGKLIRQWPEKHDDTVLCLDFSPDGRLLASGAADKIARVTEVATGKPVSLFEGHTHHVTGVAFRSDGRVLATAGADGVVSTWDMIIGERKKKIEGWTKEVTSLQFIGATNQILTSAGDNRLRVVSDEGAEVRSIANLPDYMQAGASSSSGTTLVGGGEDSLLRVWDGTSGKEIAAFGVR